MSSDAAEEIKRAIELMRKHTFEDYRHKNKELDEATGSRVTANIKQNGLMREIIHDIKFLRETDLDIREIILALMEKFNSLRNDTNFILKVVTQLSMRVKETESFQDELNQRLKNGREDIDDIRKRVQVIHETTKQTEKDIDNDMLKQKEDDDKSHDP